MQSKHQFRNLISRIISRAATVALAIATVFALTVMLTQSARAQKATAGAAWTEKVLHNFNHNGTDGYWPIASPILDAAGNLYGTTFQGGAYDLGTVFELTPTGRGWTETVLHTFSGYTDGGSPWAGLVFDTAGNLYGTTPYGGAYYDGTVFELTPTAGGGWTKQVLHSFSLNGTDGIEPYAGLIFDTAGNLYGTTSGGGEYSCNGSSQCGTVFELTPTEGGGWTEAVLHSFNLDGTDGITPYASLIRDAAGNLYGTTVYGGAYNDGTVFELTPTTGGGWTETVLHSFSGATDGGSPYAGLISDAAGNLYGTTRFGGQYGVGVVFEVTPAGTETVLHSFNQDGTDGIVPQGGLVFDTAGNLYGTTLEGGAGRNGTVFELSPAEDGGWDEMVLHSFNGADGSTPYAGLIRDAAGNLYGTTFLGGAYGGGTVFELTPIFPCARCSHAVSGEADEHPAESRDVLEQGGIERP